MIFIFNTKRRTELIWNIIELLSFFVGAGRNAFAVPLLEQLSLKNN